MAALVVVGYLAYSNGWGPLDAPAQRYSTTVEPDATTTLETADVDVQVPAGAVTRSRELRLEAVDVEDEIPFAAVHGRRMDIDLSRKLRRNATIEFFLPSDAAPDARFFAVTRSSADAPWRAVRGTRRGDRLVVRTRHFSEWRLASFSRKAISDTLSRAYREAVPTRVDRPDNCDQQPGEATVTVEPGDDPAVFACLRQSGDSYYLRLHSNRAVGMTVPIPEGWSFEDTSSPSLGEAASAALTKIGRSLPGNADGGGVAFLPATGYVTLRVPGGSPAELTTLADNSGTVFDLLLVAVAKSTDNELRGESAESVNCLFEYFGAVRDLDLKGQIRKGAECLDDAIPLAARVFLVADVFQAAAANLDAIRGKANSTVSVSFDLAEATPPDDAGTSGLTGPLTTTGLPSAEVGSSLDEVEQRTGVTLDRQTYCASPTSDADSLYFNYEDDTITTVVVDRGSDITTKSGIGIGDPLDKVFSTYRDIERITDSESFGQGPDALYRDESGNGIVFWADPDGAINLMAAGNADLLAETVEFCA